jgi:hypothetical protein
LVKRQRRFSNKYLKDLAGKMNNLKEQRKEFKKELEVVFGKGNVSVKAGTGTASYWTNVEITTTDKDARRVAQKIEAKFKWPTYLVDDGYGDSYSTCVLIQVNEIEK